ncbi:MAG: HAMP domain-containing sensor histidine kinase [Aeromicrobium sp.]
MRERLVVTLVAMTVGLIVVFGAVRAYSTADLVQDQERELVTRSADLIAATVAAHGDADVTAGFLSGLTRPAQTLTYVNTAGATIRSGAAAGHDDDISVSREVVGGGQVTLTQASSVSSDRVSDELLPLVLLGVGLAVIAAVVGWLLAQRFAYPFRRLAADAQRIGAGHFDVDVHRSSIREAADMGDALRRAAQQLDSLMQRERELAVVASHELRTPLTALRLSLEDLTMWPQTPPDVAEELQHSLAEVDRLSGVVTNLLERGDGRHLGATSDIDLNVVASEAAERWSDRAALDGRRIELVRSAAAPARVVRSPLDRVVDILIDNALVHGTGTVTVAFERAGGHLQYSVTDEGPRALETGVVHTSPAGAGADLTDAATQAESLGGFLAVADVPTTRLLLVLPHLPRPGGVDR